MTAFLEITGIAKRFGETPALVGIDLTVEHGTTVALLGPSGSGKSTLMRVIAGLEHPDEGEVRLEGRSLAGIPPSDRAFGLMFQDLALFPHLNVSDNIAFGLRMRRWSPDATRERVVELVELTRISHLLNRKTDELSGGEQQRVALARSLAPKPSLLMLDEPLGSLDRTLRDDLIEEIRGILRDEGVTALYVTHDQEEAFAIADRLVVMNGGRIVQEGLPAEVYFEPVSLFVAGFLGQRNLFSATVLSTMKGEMLVESALGQFAIPYKGGPPRADGTLLIPTDAVSIRAKPTLESDIAGTVERSVMRTGRQVISVRITGDVVLTGSIPIGERDWNPLIGDRVWAAIDNQGGRLLPW